MTTGAHDGASRDRGRRPDGAACPPVSDAQR